VAGDRAKFTLLAVSAAGRDRKPVERIDAARAAFSRRARRLSRALSRRGATAAHTAVAALWARRLQLPAPGYLRRACFSVAGGDSVVRNGTRLRRRRIRGDRAAAPRAVARRSADAPPGRYGHICRSRPARHGRARHLQGEASAWRQRAARRPAPHARNYFPRRAVGGALWRHGVGRKPTQSALKGFARAPSRRCSAPGKPSRGWFRSTKSKSGSFTCDI